MTTELALLNKSAVALAADSAVTITSPTNTKIYNTVNKLFNLNKNHPIGIMVYGDSLLLGVPWETIIKEYRKELGEEEFDSIEMQGKNFIEFVDKTHSYFSVDEKKVYNTNKQKQIFNYIKILIENDLKDNNVTTDIDKKAVIRKIIKKYEEDFKNKAFIREYKDQDIVEYIANNTQDIENLVKDIFGTLPYENDDVKDLKLIATYVLYKDYFFDYAGIVIAGFGKNELLPSIISYAIDGYIDEKVRYKVIDNEKLVSTTPALINRYGINDMIDTFMMGVSPLMEEITKNYFEDSDIEYSTELEKIDEYKQLTQEKKRIIMQSIKDSNNKILNKIQNKIIEKNLYPLYITISTLPKEDLAIMAESLVYLTFLKKRYSQEPETVGGAVDVAVISKGDGFIWIKRKHYFDKDLNPHFFKKYNVNK